jgi:plasmid stabilization system protein ParE
MKVHLHPLAEQDLTEGADFYEKCDPGTGDYFLSSILAEIQSLRRLAGIHRKERGLHRFTTHRFPFAIYYSIHREEVLVEAILDTRRSTAWIEQRLSR